MNHQGYRHEVERKIGEINRLRQKYGLSPTSRVDSASSEILAREKEKEEKKQAAVKINDVPTSKPQSDLRVSTLEPESRVEEEQEEEYELEDDEDLEEDNAYADMVPVKKVVTYYKSKSQIKTLKK